MTAKKRPAPASPETIQVLGVQRSPLAPPGVVATVSREQAAHYLSLGIVEEVQDGAGDAPAADAPEPVAEPAPEDAGS